MTGLERLFADLEESIRVADRDGWISEEEADEYIDGLIGESKDGDD